MWLYLFKYLLLVLYLFCALSDLTSTALKREDGRWGSRFKVTSQLLDLSIVAIVASRWSTV